VVTLPSLRDAGLPITDDQFIQFMNRNQIVSSQLIDDLRTALARIDLSSKNAIRSSHTRRGFERLIEQARRVRAVFDEIADVRVPQQFDELHGLILALYLEVLSLYRDCGRAILAVTIEDLAKVQQQVQAGLDRCAELSATMRDELRQANIAELLPSVDRRLTLFTGQDAHYEFQGQPDFGAVLVAALSRSSGLEDLGATALTSFPRMLSINPSTLSADQGLALYLLAAEVAASWDPMTLRRRANVFLNVLNDAWTADAAQMTAVVEAAQPDLEDAMVNLLSEADLVRTTSWDTLPPEAARLRLSQSYGTLNEWVFRRLVNPILAAKDVLDGRQRPYSVIADLSSNEKFNQLTQGADARYAAATRGIVTVTRNAGAHGGVDLSGDVIHLRAVNTKDGSVREEDLTDEQFADRLLDLLLTCLALPLAMNLFRIEHGAELPASSGSNRPRIIIEAARALVGYFGLQQAHIDASDRNSAAVIIARQAETQPEKEQRDYLPAAATLATLFRHWPALQLEVLRDGKLACRLVVSTDLALAYLALPDEAKTIGVMKVWYCSTVEPSSVPDDERYSREWVQLGARLVAQEVAELNPLRLGLPKTRRAYEEALGRTIRNAMLLQEMTREVPAPHSGVQGRDRLMASLDLLRKGLTRHVNLLRAGQWRDVQRASDGITRAVTKLTDLMM
jgi:hypothetical protein